MPRAPKTAAAVALGTAVHVEALERPYDLMGNIIAYEMGDLGEGETIALFAHLVRTGMAWTLQGCYGRAAVCLIEAGYIDRKGNIL